MVRTFCTNQIRNTEELSGSVWSFVPESGEHAGTSYSVVVPTVWENLPEFASYRGRGCFRRKFYGEGKCASCVQRNQPYSRDLFRWPPSWKTL